MSIPLIVSLSALEREKIPFEWGDNSPRTSSGGERITLKIDGQTLTYHGRGRFDARQNYQIEDTFKLSVCEQLFEKYAKEWAILTRLDFDAEGNVETSPFTKWKPNAPSFPEWVGANTRYRYE